MIKKYSDLKRLSSFEERFDYLKLSGIVGKSTFGYDRYINQLLYRSQRWKSVRDSVIIRDNGCDLGIDGCEIHGKIIVHHMNPITIEEIESECEELFNINYLISTSMETHNAIHYGNERNLKNKVINRFKNDTCPWR